MQNNLSNQSNLNNNHHFNKNMQQLHIQQQLVTAPIHYNPTSYLHIQPNIIPLYDSEAGHLNTSKMIDSHIQINNRNKNNKSNTNLKFQKDPEYYFDSGKCQLNNPVYEIILLI